MKQNQLIITMLFITLILSSLSAFGAPKKEIKIQKGYLDLSSYDFDKQGNLPLKGDWEFYWNKLLTPKDFRSEQLPVMTGHFSQPGFWKNQDFNGVKLTKLGYATYRAQIKLPKGQREIQIKLYECLSSCKLLANELDRLAHTDAFTGAYNRAFFDAALATEVNHYN